MKLWYLGALALAVLAVTACQKNPEPTAHEERPAPQITPPPPASEAPISDPYATEAPTRSNVRDVLPPPPAARSGQAGAPPKVAAAPRGARAGTQTYVVQKGDTLFSIAKKFYNDGTKWKRIQDANPQLTDPKRLKIGEKLTIPG